MKVGNTVGDQQQWVIYIVSYAKDKLWSKENGSVVWVGPIMGMG